MGADMPTLSGTSLEISRSLEAAARLFGDNLKLTAHNGDVSHVREAAIKLALIRAFQTSLGKSRTDGPLLFANLLGIFLPYIKSLVYLSSLQTLPLL